MFQDEARFGRISDTRRCWAPKGVRPKVPCQIVREYVYAYSAASPHDGELFSLILSETNAASMSIFLESVAEKYNQDHIMMIMDAASWHRAQNLKVPKNMTLIFLPPYSPQLNPVEHLWDEIREKHFANKVFKSLDAVADTLEVALKNLYIDKRAVSSITGFDWILGINLSAT